jgi:hypothetical protein
VLSVFEGELHSIFEPTALFAKRNSRTGARHSTRVPIKSYFGTRHDDCTRHYLCGKGDPLLEARYDGIVYTESFTEKKGGLSSNRLTREQLGAEIGPRICDLEPHVNREEPKTVTAKAGLAGEIKRAHSEFDTTEIPPEAKKQRGPQNRRCKFESTYHYIAQTHRLKQ